jgi:hypothetical protein
LYLQDLRPKKADDVTFEASTPQELIENTRQHRSRDPRDCQRGDRRHLRIRPSFGSTLTLQGSKLTRTIFQTVDWFLHIGQFATIFARVEVALGGSSGASKLGTSSSVLLQKLALRSLHCVNPSPTFSIALGRQHNLHTLARSCPIGFRDVHRGSICILFNLESSDRGVLWCVALCKDLSALNEDIPQLTFAVLWSRLSSDRLLPLI